MLGFATKVVSDHSLQAAMASGAADQTVRDKSGRIVASKE
jgi:hypothetical protein